MAPFSICTNPSCSFVENLHINRMAREPERGQKPRCPICGYNTTDWCQGCFAPIEPLEPEDDLAVCGRCGRDVRKVALIMELDAQYDELVDVTLRSLGQLIKIAKNRIAAFPGSVLKNLASDLNGGPLPQPQIEFHFMSTLPIWTQIRKTRRKEGTRKSLSHSLD